MHATRWAIDALLCSIPGHQPYYVFPLGILVLVANRAIQTILRHISNPLSHIESVVGY